MVSIEAFYFYIISLFELHNSLYKLALFRHCCLVNSKNNY